MLLQLGMGPTRLTPKRGSPPKRLTRQRNPFVGKPNISSGITPETSQSLKSPPQIFQWATQTTNSSRIDTGPRPDGGSNVWLIVFFAHMAGFNTFCFLNADGVLQTYYVSHFELPPSTVSWIRSLNAFLMFFTGAFSGRLTDAGYFHQTLILGTIIQLVGFFGASVANTYWQVLRAHGVEAVQIRDRIQPV